MYDFKNLDQFDFNFSIEQTVGHQGKRSLHDKTMTLGN